MSTSRAYYDADGHVIELESDIQEFYEEPYIGIPTRPLPSLDRFHTPNMASTARQPGTFEPADAAKWLQFMDKANIEWSVLYPTAGLAYGRVIYPEWATAYARAYNNWLHQKFTSSQPTPQGHGLDSLPGRAKRRSGVAPRGERTGVHCGHDSLQRSQQPCERSQVLAHLRRSRTPRLRPSRPWRQLRRPRLQHLHRLPRDPLPRHALPSGHRLHRHGGRWRS